MSKRYFLSPKCPDWFQEPGYEWVKLYFSSSSMPSWDAKRQLI
jgi:hypothetical protein